ncbi:hypothetical protein [Chryseobacterium bernardetii]|uniref:hypothetical protein n=1 Tax=Chryseobacterium bernardetii TaxID=1241978 RepID=UPI000F5106A4|nr:hypothetical protein [Chryseobacterium bernardetii]AZB33987.1 hypothetical protein EG351_10400 [Chryseobacterium bernardetii]
MVCVKLFSKLIFDSIYIENNKYYEKSFEYKKNSKEGFDKYLEKKVLGNLKTGTKVIANNKFASKFILELDESFNNKVNNHLKVSKLRSGYLELKTGVGVKDKKVGFL